MPIGNVGAQQQLIFFISVKSLAVETTIADEVKHTFLNVFCEFSDGWNALVAPGSIMWLWVLS